MRKMFRNIRHNPAPLICGTCSIAGWIGITYLTWVHYLR